VRVSQHNCSSANWVAAIGIRKVKSNLVCLRGLREQKKQGQHGNGKGKDSSFVDHCFLFPTATMVSFFKTRSEQVRERATPSRHVCASEQGAYICRNNSRFQIFLRFRKCRSSIYSDAGDLLQNRS
jgi:hypothetical protein